MSFLRRRGRGTVLAGGAALAVLLSLSALVGVRVATAPADRIPPGTMVAGIPVGGLTAEEAERAVAARAEPPGRAVELVLPGEEGFPRRVPVAELAPEPRARLAVREAMERPSVGRRILRELGLGSGREVRLRYRLEPERVRAEAARVAELVDRPPRSAALRVRGGAVRAVPAREGRRVRAEELERRLSRLPLRLAVPVAAVPPEVDDAAARAARRVAQRVVARPVAVTGAGREVTLSRDDLRSALRFRPHEGRIRVRLDTRRLQRLVAPTWSDLVVEPRRATFRVQGDSVSVVPARAGRRMDVEALERAIRARGPADRARVRMAPVRPSRTTEEAHRMRIREPVGEFTTGYACCQPRVTNIRLAARILDGTIIPAGGTFSLNEALGERTRERGFLPAPMINAGRLVNAVGGGVSQIATTFFNAAFFAGLRIVTHTPHEFYISRYPLGREATISWGGPELVVENDWPAAVLIQARTTDTSVTFRLFSSRLGRRVETTTQGTATPGTPVTYTRTVHAGGEVKRDETFRWTYRPAPAE